MPSQTAQIVLQTGRLRWSSPVLFNDLSEFQRMPVFDPLIEDAWEQYSETLVDIANGDYDIGKRKLSPHTSYLVHLISIFIKNGQSKEEIIKDISIPCPANQDHITKVLREYADAQDIDIARVCCLTDDCKNEVMWAHYSDNHKGCVFGFKDIEDEGTPFIEARPISYTNGPPIICSGLDFLLYGDTPELRRNTMEAIFYSKDAKWSYESEWRVITWRANEHNEHHGDYKFYPKELESVIFGPKIDEESRNNVLQLIKEKYAHCSIYQLVNHHGESKLKNLKG